jgi:HEAT repeat protein
VLCALLASASAAAAQTPAAPGAGAVATTGVLPLRRLVAESALVVEGVVARTDSLDDDKLRIYHLAVERTVTGDAGATEVAIVEMRGATSRPGLLADGVRAVVLLRPAPTLSYLTQHLPAGPHFSLTSGRDGIVPIADADERRVVDRVLAEGVRIGALTDEADAKAGRRALAFEELESAHPRLAADGLVELRLLDDVVTLGADEVAALERVLRTPAVAAPTRSGLIQLAGERRWTDALPALRRAEVDSPQVLQAVLTARARLGAPAGADELAPYLRSKDGDVRAAAVRALATLPEPAVAELGRLATADTDVDVRVAAIEALGTTKRPAAVTTLSQTFAEPTREVRQASGRALLAIGGPAASDALIGLALRGGDADVRKYAALLLVVSNGRESHAVQRLLASNPSGEVREVVEHGLRFEHMHEHD